MRRHNEWQDEEPEAVQEAELEEAPQEQADKDVADDHVAETIISILTTNTTLVKFALITKTEGTTPTRGLDTLQAVTVRPAMQQEEAPPSPDHQRQDVTQPLLEEGSAPEEDKAGSLEEEESIRLDWISMPQKTLEKKQLERNWKKLRL